MPRILKVKVVPKARRPGVELDGEVYKVKVSVAPEKGKANKAVVEALADFLGVAKSKLEIIQGAKGREKLIRIED